MGAKKLISIYRVQLKKVEEFEIEFDIIRSPEDVACAFRLFLNHLYGDLLPDRELAMCFYLNTKNGITGAEVISIGSLNASLLHPREVFKGAMKHNAASVILGHNHPSGCTVPSSEDIEITKRIVESGNIIGIEVLDHIILGEGKFVSLKEEGLM